MMKMTTQKFFILYSSWLIKKAWEKVDVLYVTWHFFNTHTRSVWVDIREHLKISLNIWGRQVAVGSESVDGADKDNPSSPAHFFNAFKAKHCQHHCHHNLFIVLCTITMMMMSAIYYPHRRHLSSQPSGIIVVNTHKGRRQKIGIFLGIFPK